MGNSVSWEREAVSGNCRTGLPWERGTAFCPVSQSRGDQQVGLELQIWGAKSNVMAQ